MTTPVEKWVEEQAKLTKPDKIYWCDGSDQEARRLIEIGMKEEKVEGYPVFQELNQKLSEQRSDSVRQYMLTQGIPESSIASVGRGFSVPVAPNETAAGRQKNRRVELIVSGEVIGTTIGNVKR